MLYFGCKNKTGHYLWVWDSSSPKPYTTILKEAGLYPRCDSGFCPTGPQKQGAYLLTHENGWSIIAWWDRSVDTRPGSHSTFLKHGTWSAEEMLHWANELHPDVMARQPVVPYPSEQTDSEVKE